MKDELDKKYNAMRLVEKEADEFLKVPIILAPS
jgi:hypothetical protein